VFENGLAKRTLASEYTAKGRGILGVRVAQLSDRGGDLVGALTVDEEDEVLVVMEKGKIVRSRVDEVRRTGRNTMGVQFATPDKRDSIVAVARNAERVAEVVLDVDLDDEEAPAEATGKADLDTLGSAVSDSAPQDVHDAGSVTFDRDADDNAGGSE
jgi:DNA gyrase subunit A